ncbi:uncharacterized protein G2W53_017016 [Senna tora]|uniref:Uncharacterized protein n=1 Tax=Senna tora TaxID=362788 RepID=A0A834TR63_9FABA|nr:uncharacterized protein G2W53_017016 [Senna tora]
MARFVPKKGGKIKPKRDWS